jgi:hypothetical protein
MRRVQKRYKKEAQSTKCPLFGSLAPTLAFPHHLLMFWLQRGYFAPEAGSKILTRKAKYHRIIAAFCNISTHLK